MDRQIFNLKFASKEMARNSQKCEKLHGVEKEKCKRAIRKGNIEIARIHAENAIRQKNQAINFLTMSARLDGVATRVEYAATMKRVSRSLERVTKAMECALKTKNLEELGTLLDKFDRQCLDMDVQALTMDSSMQQTSTGVAPHGEIETFMQQVAEEAGLDMSLEMPSARQTISSISESTEKRELETRLTALRKG